MLCLCLVDDPIMIFLPALGSPVDKSFTFVGLRLLSQSPIFKKQIGLLLLKNQSFSEGCWYVVLLVVMMNGIP